MTGRTEASTTVEVRSRLTGQLVKVHFKDGAAVKKGEILFELDDRLQTAEVEKAQAEHRRGEARLKAAELDYGRLVKLGEAKSVSQDEVQRSAAAVEEAKATLLAARAAVDVARINLEFTRIVSPIDGRIGRAKVAAGDLVRAPSRWPRSTRPIPLHVYFDLDEPTVLRLVRYTRDRRGREDDSRPRPDRGRRISAARPSVDFLDPALDPKTGTLRVRAVLSNPKEDSSARPVRADPRSVGQPEKGTGSPGRGVGRVAVRRPSGADCQRQESAGGTGDRDRDGTRPDGGNHEGLTAADRVVRRPAWTQGRGGGQSEIGKGHVSKPGGIGVANPTSPSAPRPAGQRTGPDRQRHVSGVERQHGGGHGRPPRSISSSTDLEKLTHRVLACGDDGTMRLTLLFEKGTDLNKAQVLAQNRIAVALPQLPDEVRRLGITVRKRGVALAAVAVRSPTDQYDRTFLARYAKARLRDELARVPGVADVSFYADAEPSPRVRLHIDRDKMAALGLTVGDLTKALEQQNMKAEAVTGSHLALTISGRLPDPDQLGRLRNRQRPGSKDPAGHRGPGRARRGLGCGDQH